MTPLLYFIVAVLAAALGTRAFLADQDDAARRAFLGLGWAVAISYAAFSLSLLPGLQSFRLLYMLAGCLVPGMCLWTFDRIFDDQVSRTPARLVLVASGVLAPLLTFAHVAFFSTTPRASIPEAIAGTLCFIGFGLALARLWQAHEHTSLQVERVRLRYLIGVAAAAVLLTLAEHLARNLGPPVDPTGLSLGSRAVALQGALPPFSVIFTAIALYLLHHTLVLSRLLDLHELFSRMGALLISAGILLLIDGMTFMWVDAFSTYPFHSTFQIFLASLLFLVIYEPARPYIAWASSRLFNQRGQRLQDTLVNLVQTLPTVISKEGLAEMLLSKLHASGRVPVCSVYLWDPRVDAFACTAHRGHGETRPLKAVARGPFSNPLQESTPWYARSTVARAARTDPEAEEILALMDAMRTDLAMPFVQAGLVLGWLNLRDEDWSDGYSADEILRIEEVADLGTVVLSNIRDFQELQEKDRLAALGQMAAGLAHEIRNPLAGVKGAAQYLQSENLDGDAKDMLNVIIDEANRLDTVVRQFLDYARPFELHLSAEHLNAIVTHVITLVRAGSLPASVTITHDLSGELPTMHLDSTRISQVLINLIQNAIQAMPEGGVVSVHTSRAQNRFGEPLVEVGVSDTGRGIESDVMSQLFIPFFTTKKAGTGLGLSICQRIVQAHGGELDVQSAENRGAAFIVRLPLPELTEEAREAAK